MVSGASGSARSQKTQKWKGSNTIGTGERAWQKRQKTRRDMQRRTRRSASTIEGAAPDTIIGRAAADCAGARPYQPLATSHYLPHRLRDAGNVGAIGVFQDRRERHRNIRRSNAHNRSLEIIAEPLKETGCDFCADTASLWTFLDNHDTACLLDGLTDSSVVNRRKTAHIDNLSMNVARGECLGGEHAEVGHQQPTENGCIRAFAPYHGSIKRHHELLLGDVARRIYPSRFCTRPFRAVKQFMLKNHNRIVIAYGGFQNSLGIVSVRYRDGFQPGNTNKIPFHVLGMLRTSSRRTYWYTND